MEQSWIQFNQPYMTGNEYKYISRAKAGHRLAGDGEFTDKCHRLIKEQTGCSGVLLTHSCTAALEMTALLLDISPGDEIIMPSYTFASTANAFVLRGGIPVFVDIREDTLNIDENLIEAAITPKTRAIVAVHYAGVSCEMDLIMEIARRHHLSVVEDAAQGVMARYKGKALGTFGDFGTYSFHETKNIICGEGGALLINRNDFLPRAEIIRDKGTDRSRFSRGEVDKYTWQEAGSSYLPGELVAAFLFAQLEQAEIITAKRLEIWQYYDVNLAPLESLGLLRRPHVPIDCQHNAHMYYLLLDPSINRQKIIEILKTQQIGAIFHYVPLHSSPAGRRYGRCSGSLPITEKQSSCIIRLPLWLGLKHDQQARIIDVLRNAISKLQ